MRSLRDAMAKDGRLLLCDFHRDPERIKSMPPGWALEHIRVSATPGSPHPPYLRKRHRTPAAHVNAWPAEYGGVHPVHPFPSSPPPLPVHNTCMPRPLRQADQATFRAEVERAGFRLVASPELEELQENYLMVFEKDGD